MNTTPKKILMPLPSHDFDPTEVAIPWMILSTSGLSVSIATPSGLPGVCDQRMLTGKGLGPLAMILAANKDAVSCYQNFERSNEFKNPLNWKQINAEDFDGLILPGGHAPGMREYLESSVLQKITADFFAKNKPVGAICHGVVLAARSTNEMQQSVLFNRKTTALLKSQEMAAWNLTRAWLGTYYRTYPETTVEEEVTAKLASPSQFIKGPTPLLRDSSKNLKAGFVVRDGNYLSARWPGDAHLFATTFVQMMQENL